jgi:putative tricarboxylic transport membrane protein
LLTPEVCPDWKGRLRKELYQQEGNLKNRDLVSSIIWMALGGLFVVGALQLGLTRRGVPGPGFLPFLTGLALIFVSLFVLIPALGRRKNAESSDFFPERDSFRKLLFVLVALFTFGIAMKYLGYLLTAFLFMFFVALVMKPKGWRTTALLALVTAVVSYALFVVLLEVNLPKGLLGF